MSSPGETARDLLLGRKNDGVSNFSDVMATKSRKGTGFSEEKRSNRETAVVPYTGRQSASSQRSIQEAAQSSDGHVVTVKIDPALERLLTQQAQTSNSKSCQDWLLAVLPLIMAGVAVPTMGASVSASLFWGLTFSPLAMNLFSILRDVKCCKQSPLPEAKEQPRSDWWGINLVKSKGRILFTTALSGLGYMGSQALGFGGAADMVVRAGQVFAATAGIVGTSVEAAKNCCDRPAAPPPLPAVTPS